MPESNPKPYELRILGAPDLRGPDGRRVTSLLSQPYRLGLLAYLALAPGPVTRASLVARFWPERDEGRARNALSQALFYLRRSLGKDVVQSVEGDRLQVTVERVWCDARELLRAERPSPELLEAAAEGELLAGWNAEASQPLQEWLDGMRRTVRERAAELEREGAVRARAPTGGRPRPRRGARGPAWPPGDGLPGPNPAHAVRDIRLRTTAALAVSVAALVLVAVVALRGRGPSSDVLPSDSPSDVSPGSPAATDPARLVVLLPRVTAFDGASGLSALTLNAELLVRLPSTERLSVVSLPTAASLQELMTQRARVGAQGGDMPDWILDLGVDVTERAVHVHWLLYRGPDQAVFGADSFDEPLDGPDDLVTDVPRAIAEEVTAAVGALLR